MSTTHHTSSTQATNARNAAKNDAKQDSNADFETMSQVSRIFDDDAPIQTEAKGLLRVAFNPHVALAVGWGLVIMSHVFNSFEPVLGRYLLHDQGIPVFTLMFLVSIPYTIVLTPIQTVVNCIRDRNALKEHAKGFFGHWTLYIFFASTFLRSLTIILASKWTASVYVQMVSLLAPFVVALGERLVMKRRIIWQMMVGLLFITLGGLLVVGSGTTKADGEWGWLPDFTAVMHGFNFMDALGILATFVSNGLLATYLICVEMHPETYTPTTLLILHMASVSLFSAPIALLEIPQWHTFGNLNAWGWMAVLGMSISVHFVGFYAQIFAVEIVGATSVSAFLAFRLCCTIFFAWILLGERLNNLFQYLGMVMIMLAVTFYMGSKAWRERRDMKLAKARESDLIADDIHNHFVMDSESDESVRGGEQSV